MYKDCPVCGKNITKSKPNLFICSSCGFHFYQNPIPATGVIIINKRNEVLLVKRKFPPYKNYWDVPGGFIEQNESAEESMKRQLMESGVEISRLGRRSGYVLNADSILCALFASHDGRCF